MPLKYSRTVVVSLALAAMLVASLAGQTHASSTPAGAVFLNSASSTDSPTLRVDGAGGMHLAFAGYNTGINPGDDPSQPGYYAYCDPNADCSVAGNWTQVALGTHVQAAQLQLTPAGQPRILLETADFASGDTVSYWYAACDGGCTDPGNWLVLDLVDTTSIVGDVWNQPKHSFALDSQGNPRFLYSAGMLVYATCDTACTDTTTDPNSGQTVPANWVFAQISTGLNFNQLSLGFTSAGQPRAAGFGFNSSDFSFGVDYLECNANCYDGSQWSVTNLMPQGQAPLAVSLRVDGSDGVGVALSQSNQLWYWQCGGGGCADPARWLWTRWDGLSGYVQDADLAFDAQNQPHLALRSSGGPFGWGLAEMACVASCTTGDAAWTGEQLEDVSRLSQDLPQLLPANCTTGGWFGDFRPSLSLDPAGNLRVAFDNQFWVSGCSDNVDVRTEFEAVRVVYTGPALASSQARAATAAAAPSTAKQPVKLAASHGKGATVGQHDPARLLSRPGPHPSHTPPGGFGRSHQAPTRGHAPAPARARR